MAALITLVLCSSALLCAYGASINKIPDAKHYDTIVIGLGAAGTTAASTLAAAGKRVLALEAQDRVGGRVNTVPFGDGVLELGGEWIHGQFDGKNPSWTYGAALRNNVSVIVESTDMIVYRSDGTHANSSLVLELMEFVGNCIENPPEKPEPRGQYITRRVLDYIKDKHPALLKDQGFMDELLNAADLVTDSSDATNSWNDISTDYKFKKLGGHQHVSWSRSGYKTFFEILLKTYNNGPGLPALTIKLNTEVKKIEYSEEASKPVSVTTVDGTTYTADNVIVTVSLGVLKERYDTLFSPKLPVTKIAAINHMTIGVLDKTTLLFDKQWWQDDKWFMFVWRPEDKQNIPEDDAWTTKIILGSAPRSCSNAFTLWTTGDTAKLVETLPEDLVKRKMMDLIRKFMGADVEIPEPTAILRSTWNSNPFTRGSYTYDNIESSDYPTVRTDLAAPLTDSAGKPRILFAGEATSSSHFATVHGAAETGYREAMRLL